MACQVSAVIYSFFFPFLVAKLYSYWSGGMLFSLDVHTDLPDQTARNSPNLPGLEIYYSAAEQG